MANPQRTRTFAEFLIKHIGNGRLDDYLDQILGAIHARQKFEREQRARENFTKLKPGDRVKITGRIKPQYLHGLKGRVENPDDINNLIPDRYNRIMAIPITLDAGRVRKYGPRVWVPASLLTKLDQ